MVKRNQTIRRQIVKPLSKIFYKNKLEDILSILTDLRQNNFKITSYLLGKTIIDMVPKDK